MEMTKDFAEKFLPFASYSYYPTNRDLKSQESQIKRRNIAIAGDNDSDDDDNAFYEIILNNKTNVIQYKSFKTHYNKKYANLKHIGLSNASHNYRYIHSYLVRNNKYIIVFTSDIRYNVYDIENDKWLLNQAEKKLEKHNQSFSRSILINDEIIIVSEEKQLYFYFIGNDHIIDPILIHTYQLETDGVAFNNHGMVVIDFKLIKPKQKLNKQNDNNNNHINNYKYKLKILLFGGYTNKDILSSFLFLDVLLSYDDDVNDKVENSCNIILSIDENLIDYNLIKLINFDEKKRLKQWYNFSCQCFFNDKNEAVIVTIGGNYVFRQIYLYNCVTHELTRKDKVLFMYIV